MCFTLRLHTSAAPTRVGLTQALGGYQLMVQFAAFLVVALGLAHSILGERYILMRLFRREDLPNIFGSAKFTAQNLRFA